MQQWLEVAFRESAKWSHFKEYRRFQNAVEIHWQFQWWQNGSVGYDDDNDDAVLTLSVRLRI
jgi:hypothetical protein